MSILHIVMTAQGSAAARFSSLTTSTRVIFSPRPSKTRDKASNTQVPGCSTRWGCLRALHFCQSLTPTAMRQGTPATMQGSTCGAKPPHPAHTQSPLVRNTMRGSLKTAPAHMGWWKGPSLPYQSAALLRCHLAFPGVHLEGNLTGRKGRGQKVHTTMVLPRVCQAAPSFTPPMYSK